MDAVELAWGDTVIEGHPKLDPKLAGRYFEFDSPT